MTDDSAFLTHCNLCPRRCGADRTKARGRCGASAYAEVALCVLHRFEEPFLSGADDAPGGSGTVFFRHCALQCAYCQNRAVSRCQPGGAWDGARLADAMLRLQAEGAYNINCVTPTHYTPHICSAIKRARQAGLTVPVVWNTSGYELPRTLAMLEGVADIYLTDFKYRDPNLAKRYSDAPDYFDAAWAALSEMTRQTGAPVYGADGMMKRGTVVRHLTLPGALYDSKAVLSALFGRYGNTVVYSIMNQYTPMPHTDTAAFPELGRTVSPRHYAALLAHARSLGIDNAFVQRGGTQSQSFIPDFFEK